MSKRFNWALKNYAGTELIYLRAVEAERKFQVTIEDANFEAVADSRFRSSATRPSQ